MLDVVQHLPESCMPQAESWTPQAKAAAPKWMPMLLDLVLVESVRTLRVGIVDDYIASSPEH